MKHLKTFEENTGAVYGPGNKDNAGNRYNEDGDLIYTWDTEWDKDTMESLLNKAYNFICDYKYKGDCRNFNEFDSPEEALGILEDVLDEIKDEELYKFIKSSLYDKIKEYQNL